MKVFNSSNLLENAFTSLEAVVSPTSKVFFDTLPNCPYKKNPIVGSLVMKTKELTADTGSDMDSSSRLTANAMSTVTAFSSIFGILTLDKVHNSYKASDAMHDERGKAIATLDGSLRVSQITVGFTSIFSRFSAKTLPLASASALMIAMFSMDFLYLGLAAVSGVSIQESNNFLKRLKKAEGNLSELKSLLAELVGKGECELGKSISNRDIYTHLGIELRSMLDEIDPNLTTRLSNKTLGKALFDEKYSKFLKPILNRMSIKADESSLSLESLKKNKELIQNIWAKEKSFVFDRILGFRGTKLIQRAKEMRLYEQLGDVKTKEYSEVAVRELFQELKNCAKEERLTSLIYFSAAAIGGFFSVIAKTFILPLETAISKVGFLVFFLLLGYGDLREFMEVYKSGVRAGEYAKFFSGTHLLLGVLALSAFAVSSVLTGGALPLVSLLIVGGVWISVDISMLYFMHKRDKEYKEDHPSLKEFLNKLESTDFDYLSQETLEMFHKLPKLQREAILSTLLQSDQEVMKVYASKLRTFNDQSLFECKTLEGMGRLLYKDPKKDKKIVEKSLEKANQILIGKSSPLNRETLATHPSSHLFYRTFFNEVAKSEQQRFCLSVGKKRLQNAVRKVIGTSLPLKNPSAKISVNTKENRLILKKV
jgi:hypothetical protein